MSIDPAQSNFELALQFIRYTDQHVFLTGKAGTGKTFFLQRIKKESEKNMVVLAPTGVAAIHAGGVTIHSFFQLAPSLFLPEPMHTWGNSSVSIQTPETILRNIRFNAQKKELIEELEMIVIDEVSMLRADMLDAIDTMLRQIRKKFSVPFGGVQMLFIGDLFQLPPVVKPEDWELMKPFYESPFFFDARVMRQCTPVCIELKKIWRQNDPYFIQILNAIRNSEVSQEDLEYIHQFYKPYHHPNEDDFHITLTTHNAKADLMNHRALAALPGDVLFFDAEIEGDFPEKSFPAESRLALKKDARIMFIRNDKGESRRYFNGKLAKVDRIEEGKKIFVRFDEDGECLELEAETWKNIRYRYDKEKEGIEEEELGSFKQFPIRLAWAITIHKSQGLTFEKAIIDAGDSFTAGQVYVALSRLTGLSGLILKSKIFPSSIQTDPRVIEFCRNDVSIQSLAEQLNQDKSNFIRKSIIHAFDFSRILRYLRRHQEHQATIFSIEAQTEITGFPEALESFRKLQITADNFSEKLRQLLDTDEGNGYAFLLERCRSAVNYFLAQLQTCKTSLEDEIRSIRLRSRQKKPLVYLRELISMVDKKERLLQQALELAKGLADRQAMDALIAMAEKRNILAEAAPHQEWKPSSVKSSGTKKDKEPSSSITLQMFKSGTPLEEIAKARSITLSTVFGHIIPFIGSGELPLDSIVNPSKTKMILEAVDKTSDTRLKTIKEMLGDEVSYDEIRAVLVTRPKDPEGAQRS